MKAFKRWLKGKVAGIGWYAGVEGGWKAALDWILQETYVLHDKQDVIYYLREELEKKEDED